MKKLFLLLAASATLAHADLTVTQQFQKGSQTVDVVMKIKDGKIRMDPNPQMSVIIDAKTGDSLNLIHPQKKVLTLSADMVKKMRDAQMGGAKPAAGAVEAPKPTGKKETINGYACEEYETAVNGTKIQLWLTKDLPAAQKAMADLAALAPDSDPMKSLLKGGELPGFPMKTVITDASGDTSSVVVKSLNEDPLSADDFTVPAGYEKMEMPAGMPGQ